VSYSFGADEDLGMSTTPQPAGKPSAGTWAIVGLFLLLGLCWLLEYLATGVVQIPLKDGKGGYVANRGVVAICAFATPLGLGLLGLTMCLRRRRIHRRQIPTSEDAW
jgi:hypothetical protein